MKNTAENLCVVFEGTPCVKPYELPFVHNVGVFAYRYG